MGKLKKVCVFCGANRGARAEYAQAAVELGKELARRNIELVFGAGNCGLMGILADTVLACGGMVTGIIPKGFPESVLHKKIPRTIFTDDMSARKLAMEDISDAFIAMSGGIGTLDEIFQTMTLAQLNFLSKPSGFLNTLGYYDKLFDFLKHAHTEGFLPTSTLSAAFLSAEPSALLDMLENA